MVILSEGNSLAAGALVARSPADKSSFIPVSVDENHMKRLAGNFCTVKIYEYQHLIVGFPPTVNNIGYHERSNPVFAGASWSGLREAKSLFKGLKRPLDCQNGDSNIYIYVLSPEYTYTYVANMVCCAKMTRAPFNSVFVVYVRFSDDLSAGKILHWEWVTSEDCTKPDDCENRYDQEVWRA